MTRKELEQIILKAIRERTQCDIERDMGDDFHCEYCDAWAVADAIWPMLEQRQDG